MKEGSVNIFTDNRKLAISLNEGVDKASEGAQDADLSIAEAIKIINGYTLIKQLDIQNQNRN